jgi:hypothetical protein
MHDNAIHDLALVYWSVWLSPIKRAASLANRNSPGKVCDWLFFNRNICRHFVSVGGKQTIDQITSATVIEHWEIRTYSDLSQLERVDSG